MDSYKFDSGELVIKTNNLEEFVKIIIKVGYQNITSLDCSDNSLTSLPSELGNLTRLTHLNCYVNKLTSLPPELGNLTSLTHLDCYNNQLTSLPSELGNLNHLTYFNCSDNRLISLPSELGNLTHLTYFNCSDNRLISLPSELGNLINLTNLNCFSNQLTSLPSELGNLTHLTHFNCSSNQLTSLPSELGNLTHLTEFYYEGNPIEYIPPNVLRLIERRRISHNIYNDSQSVHDSSIQRGVKESLQKLLSEKPILTSEKMWEYLLSRLSPESVSLLLEYSEFPDIHSILGVTFSEALLSVVSTIYQSEYQEEILKTLNIEISDSECKCFTGRISRLVNTLNGYDDRVNIQIPENDQLGTIISLLGEFEPYDPEIHRNRSREELLSRGYPKETVEEWVSHII